MTDRASGPGWDPAAYLRFADQRSRPARDLLAALPPGPRARIVDMGCGPGNSTRLLRALFPEAALLAVDPDPAMRRAAREALPGIPVVAGRAEDWAPDAQAFGGQAPDLILANASLHWALDLPHVLTRLTAMLAPGGVLAVQMPDNLDEPSHRAMRAVAADPAWAARCLPLGGGRAALPDMAALHRLLRPVTARLDLWRTTYQVELDDPDAIAAWFAGSGLGPFLAPLTPPERARFLDLYRDALRRDYPPLGLGRVLLAFPRLFLVAEAPG